MWVARELGMGVGNKSKHISSWGGVGAGGGGGGGSRWSGYEGVYVGVNVRFCVGVYVDL